jgi:PAS domain S-box-containing protein
MGDAAATIAHRPGLDEAGLRALVEQAPDGIFVADVDGCCIYVNDAGCRLTGYSHEEILDRRIADLVPAKDLARLERARAVMLEGRTGASQWTLQRKDGSSLPVEVTATILANGHWQAYVRDVSDREALFRRIDTERRWRQAVMDTLPLGVVLFEPDAKISVNRHAEELFGDKLSPAGQSEQYASRIFFPDGRRVPPEKLAGPRVMGRGETILGVEYVIHRPDGTRLPVLASAAPIVDGAGRIIGGVGVLQDASERMRLEQAVQANERLLKTVFDILPVGLWITDQDGRITLSNPAAERIWRNPQGRVPGKLGDYKGWWVKTAEAVAPEEWAISRAIRLGETSRSELVRIQCFDGSIRTVLNWGAPILSDSGEISGAVAVNEDVTVLQQTQEQLRGAVRDREEILAVVTHDLRNPLSALRLVAATAERKARGLAGGEPIRSLAASITDIARSMSNLVDDLLAVAVSGPDRSMLKIAPIEAGALLAKAAEAARPLFVRQGIELEVQAAGDLPVIQADAHRVLRVFANLLDNAIKFTETPGKALLRAEALSGGVRFCVSNTGPALSAQEMTSMFQPFWQSGREDRRGAGLGLAICRSMVEAHGGSIWAEAATGQRVRICFLLPCAHETQPISPAGPG